MSIKEIEERINKMRELEDQLTNAGPARAESIFIAQSSIQEYYYADVSDLIDLIESQAKEIERQRDIIDHASRVLSIMPDSIVVRMWLKRYNKEVLASDQTTQVRSEENGS